MKIENLLDNIKARWHAQWLWNGRVMIQVSRNMLVSITKLYISKKLLKYKCEDQWNKTFYKNIKFE